jgi:hypothetical protein
LHGCSKPVETPKHLCANEVQEIAKIAYRIIITQSKSMIAFKRVEKHGLDGEVKSGVVNNDNKSATLKNARIKYQVTIMNGGQVLEVRRAETGKPKSIEFCLKKST